MPFGGSVPEALSSGSGGSYGEGMRSSPSGPVLVRSLPIVILVLVASIAGLVAPGTYAQETANWAIQAQGQDIGNLLAVVVLVAAAQAHRRGSARAGQVWLGTLTYLVYAFIVYAFAVHFTALFPVYVAVLGLSAWSIIFHVDGLRSPAPRYPAGRWRTAAAIFLVSTGLLFAALWLAELVPALVRGQTPASITEAGLWVNPIHVIDLSMVLPGFVLTGIAALRGRPFGLFWLGPWLVFSVLMGSSIVAAMVLMAAGGWADVVAPMLMVSVVVLASLAVVAGWLGRSVEVRRAG